MLKKKGKMTWVGAHNRGGERAFTLLTRKKEKFSKILGQSAVKEKENLRAGKGGTVAGGLSDIGTPIL